MSKSHRIPPFLLFLLLNFESAYGILGYCNRHTFENPPKDELLYFSKENSDKEFGIYDKFKALHCCSHGYLSIEWFKDGVPYPWSTAFSTLIIYPESRNQTIYTQHLTSYDSGNYWCVASNDTYLIQHEVTLVAAEPSISMGFPKPSYIPRDQEVDEGESARFYCEAFVGVIDLPDFQSEIYWERYDKNQSFVDGVRVIQDIVIREEKLVLGSYLFFKEVRKEDYGEYRCNVRNLGDQTIILSAWIKPKLVYMDPPEDTFNEIYRFVETYWIIVLFVFTGIISFGTLFHLSWQWRNRRHAVADMSSPDGMKDLLVIYHENDSTDALKTVLPAMKNRYHYSCSLHPISLQTDIEAGVLQTKARLYKALLALMTPSLVGGNWSCENISRTIQTLFKMHSTIICIFLQNLPVGNGSISAEDFMKESLTKINIADKDKAKVKLWYLVDQKHHFPIKETATIGNPQVLI